MSRILYHFAFKFVVFYRALFFYFVTLPVWWAQGRQMASPRETHNQAISAQLLSSRQAQSFSFSFQLLSAQPLIDYHTRSAWFLLHQQMQHHSRHLCTTQTAPADFPVSSRPRAELHRLFELGQRDPEDIPFGFGQPSRTRPK